MSLFEAGLRESLDLQEKTVLNSSAQLVEHIENIKSEFLKAIEEIDELRVQYQELIDEMIEFRNTLKDKN